MSDYNRNNRGGGGRGRGHGGGGGRDFNRRDSGPREMHSAVCDECGNNCEVPFKPRGDKPIYCSNCFEKKDGGDSRRPARRDSRDSRGSGSGNRDNGSHKEMMEQLGSLNTKLDRILGVLESHVEKKVVKKATKKAAPKVKKAATKKPKEEKKG